MNLFEKARITHVRRAQNERADALANLYRAMDEAAFVEELGGGEYPSF